MWGYVKSLVYADKPQTLDHLEDNIRRVIADIRPQMLEKVTENWTSRLDYIRASRGSPMPEIIFKISCAHVASVLWYLGYWRHNHTQVKTPSLGYADTLQDTATGWPSGDSASKNENEI
ncbi:hypothetical protein TNCV_1444601 [Trichonephila clavipes]|nr:hypothetical protein TNCV_1444601 [Trichonephila clavipes]